MDQFLYDRDLRHERVHVDKLVIAITNNFSKGFHLK